MRRRSRNAGFTLIELILVMVLIGIMAASTTMLVLQGTKSYADLVNRKESLHNARLAMERISREVRVASDASPVSSSRLRLNGGVIEFYHDAATKTAKIDPGGYILAEGISALTFNLDPGNPKTWVQISLTESSGPKYRTKAYLRKEIFYPQ